MTEDDYTQNEENNINQLRSECDMFAAERLSGFVLLSLYFCYSYAVLVIQKFK